MSTPGSAKNAVHWFEIPATDLNRAKTFYERVLGVTLAPMDQGPYRMAWFPARPGAPGSAGSLVAGPGRTPSRQGTLVYLTVPDVDAALAKVAEQGGKVVLPTASGDYGAIAHFEDCEGNLVALHAEPVRASV